MEAPFRADDVAMAGRIEQLESEIAQARAELAQLLATIPENGDAYVRRLMEENAELHEECAELGREITELHRALADVGRAASP